MIKCSNVSLLNKIINLFLKSLKDPQLLNSIISETGKINLRPLLIYFKSCSRFFIIRHIHNQTGYNQ